MGGAQWGLIGIAVLLIGRQIWRGQQRRWLPSGWAQEIGLELTPRNEPFVRSYIVRTRILRIAGGVVGFLAPIAYSEFAGGPPPIPFDFILLDALVGYLVGAVLAEITVRRPKTDVPTASLVPRDLHDYLPSFYTRTLRLAAATALGLYPLYVVISGRERDELPPAIVMVSMILLILLGVELLQRYIVGRPQPAVAADLMRADDAVRSASVHALAGAGIALELLIASVEILGLAVTSDTRLLRWTLPWISVICFGLALGSWQHLTRPYNWQVRRTQREANA
jgi:hypothetical protein